ncbi:MAG: quinolinate synthase NadA [Euryarchaeota archaeon]|nr:quinolinate synthase NadA [Euryarchaeota archaeon]
MIDAKTLAEIEELKEDCIILAHNYQIPPIQDVADFVADSLDLCRYATKVEKPYILFCGVDFMAESAAILNPDKTVLMPEPAAHCPMAAMLPAERLRQEKERHPDAAVVLYINTRVEARALADVTCTSANAVKICAALEEEEILFGPDKNLAWHVQRHLPEKRIIPVPAEGHCRVHVKFKKEHVERARKEHPEAEVLVHPECNPEVQLEADHICSTEQMARRARASGAREFVIGTETGLCYKLKKENPEKEFYPLLETAVCRTMKKNTWEKFMEELRQRRNVITVEPGTAERARKALERMLELSK